jgi:hypothetical protein
MIAQIDFPIVDNLQDFGQTSFNVEGVLVMTLFTFALTALIFMLYKLRVGNKPKTGDLTPALQTLGGIIANQMKDVVEDAKADRAMFMESFATQSREHTGIVDGLKDLGDGLKDLANILVGNTSTVAANQTTLTQLSTDQQATNKQVETMNGDIIEIKKSIETMVEVQKTMNNKVDELSNAVKPLLDYIAKLQKETEAPTMPIDLPLAPKPETPTIEAPVVPKPDATPKKDVSL